MSVTNMSVSTDGMLGTREAAKQVGMTHDYIARLAREGKVAAQLCGRRWFVDGASLQEFIRQNELEKQSQYQRVRQQRLTEMRVKELDQLAVSASVSTYSKITIDALQSVAVVLLGLLFGLVMYVGAVYSSPVALGRTVMQLASAPSAFAVVPTAPQLPSGQYAAIGSTGPSLASDSDSVQAVSHEVEPVAFESNRPFVLLGDTTASTTVEYLHSLFSDPVIIEFSDAGTGRISIELKDGTSEPVDFLMVPNGEESSLHLGSQ